MVTEYKTSKIHDIKETASDAVEILRQIGTPGVQESMDKVRETATVAKQIVESLKAPEIVKNIENIRLISENMNAASSNIQKAVEQLKETGVIDETKELIKSTKSKIDSFGGADGNNMTGQNLRDVTIAIKEMLVSITGLVDELRVTVASSKKSVVVHNMEDTIKEAVDIYKTVR